MIMLRLVTVNIDSVLTISHLSTNSILSGTVVLHGPDKLCPVLTQTVLMGITVDLLQKTKWLQE